MTEWRPLLIEVMGWHRDIDNHSYNVCETEPCTWSERAAMALAAPAPVALTVDDPLPRAALLRRVARYS